MTFLEKFTKYRNSAFPVFPESESECAPFFTLAEIDAHVSGVCEDEIKGHRLHLHPITSETIQKLEILIADFAEGGHNEAESYTKCLRSLAVSYLQAQKE